MIPIIERAAQFSTRNAIVSNGNNYTYENLLNTASRIASFLIGNHHRLEGERIALMIDPSFEYVAAQWGIWMTGAIAVPICTIHPADHIRFTLVNSGSRAVISSPQFDEILSLSTEGIPILMYGINDCLTQSILSPPDVSADSAALILYTSGTTKRPKGVVISHRNITAQIKTLVSAWEWARDDHILNILPLHHVHGLINVLGCALWSGAKCEFPAKFSPETVIDIFLQGNVNLFMAVPTVYYKLIKSWETLHESKQKEFLKVCDKFRLMVSGSAALPVPVLEKWESITGHRLLERYGMTEIGMALSNPYRGERRPGYVGTPLPGVKISLLSEDGYPVSTGHPGEIHVQGPAVFKEYWQLPEETANNFTADGWFKTGDIAFRDTDGYYKILGRNSVDIIKSGGYKISALEIEEALLGCKGVLECAVVGIPDEEWGQLIVAYLVVRDGQFSMEALKQWLKKVLPSYKMPRKFHLVSDLPRNSLGKVTKNELIG